MEYSKIYERLIDRARGRLLEGYSESHHIVPRCMGGSNAAENLVQLLPEEHYVAHQLLVKIYPDNYRLVGALKIMVTNRRNTPRNNKEYAWVRRKVSEMMTVNNPNKGGHSRRKYISDYKEKHGQGPERNWHLTEGGRKILRESKLGRNNPNHAVPPWRNHRSTDYTRSVWEKADLLFLLWKDNNQPSYARLYNMHNGHSYLQNKSMIAPYMSMIKYFRKNWIPENDDSWIAWRSE